MVPIRYNVRSLVVRKRTTFAAAFGIALVVWVFASAQMLSGSLEKTFGRHAGSNVAVVTRKGANNELQSSINDAQVGLVLAHAQQIGATSRPIGVSEVSVVIILPRADGSGVANVPVRGVNDDVLQFRSTTKIVEGNAAKPGTDEVIVGQSIRGRFKGLQIGQSFELTKGRKARVVGVFSDGGSAFESEVWGDKNYVRQAFGRDGFVSTVRVRLDKKESLESFRRIIEGDRQLSLAVISEPAFFVKQSRASSATLTFIGQLISFFFAIGAMIGATITMNAQVAGRTKEIGTLRALGFSRFGILTSFLIESSVLSLFGGAFGAIASLAMVSVKVTLLNRGTWSLVVVGFEPTPEIVISAMVMALTMGLVGGFIPAVRAARTSPVAAMRSE